MTTNNEAFEKWFENNIQGLAYPNNEPAILAKHNAKCGWQAATTEANKRIAELKREAELTDIVIVAKEIHLNDKNLKISELQAHINTLHEALEEALERKDQNLNAVENVATELQASNNRLREALSLCNFDASVFDKEVRFEYQEKVRKARLETPAESLQAHDNEVIEKCAEIVWFYDRISLEASEELVSRLRALKGKV